MNFQKFFNKWWLMLLYGVLLIFLSYFLFSYRYQLFLTSGIIVGFITLLTGSVSISGYFFAGRNYRSSLELICGIFSWLTGLFFLSGIQITNEFNNWLFFTYMTMNALILASTAWYLKDEISWWWLTLVHLFYTLLVGYFLLSDGNTLHLLLTVFTGIQFFTNGLMMILFAFGLRRSQLEFSKTIQQLREEGNELFD